MNFKSIKPTRLTLLKLVALACTMSCGEKNTEESNLNGLGSRNYIECKKVSAHEVTDCHIIGKKLDETIYVTDDPEVAKDIFVTYALTCDSGRGPVKTSLVIQEEGVNLNPVQLKTNSSEKGSERVTFRNSTGKIHLTWDENEGFKFGSMYFTVSEKWPCDLSFQFGSSASAQQVSIWKKEVEMADTQISTEIKQYAELQSLKSFAVGETIPVGDGSVAKGKIDILLARYQERQDNLEAKIKEETSATDYESDAAKKARVAVLRQQVSFQTAVLNLLHDAANDHHADVERIQALLAESFGKIKTLRTSVETIKASADKYADKSLKECIELLSRIEAVLRRNV